MIDYDALSTFEDWADALDTLLAAADDAVQNGDANARTAAQRDLREFRRRSPPGAEMARLDRIARQAVRDIAAQAVEDAIASIAERSNELDDLVVQLRGASASANRVARIINLESPTTIVTSLTEVVASLKNLRDGFTPEADVEEITKRVEAGIAAITKLRDSIEGAT